MSRPTETGVVGGPPASAIDDEGRPWYVYLIECRDGSFYAGIAVDVAARFALHARGRGARYTRSHPPVRLAWAAQYPDRSSALKAEYAIRRLPAARKREMAAAYETGVTIAGAIVGEAPTTARDGGHEEPR